VSLASIGKENLWLQEVTNNTIVFLNRGAHFQETAKLVFQVRLVLGHLSRNFPGALLFYRATNLPIPLANFTSEPSRDPFPVDVLAKYPESRETHGWRHFHEQNEAVKKLVRNEFPQVIYLDIEYMTRFRTDSNRDPLHACVPGVTSMWWTLFSHALINAESVD
jgi:hypothetical protein